jgi:hypothetical protein|nr:MAG TPA: bacteriocin [Caudoviricetes sp.]
MNYSVVLDLKGNILEKLKLVDEELKSINKRARNVRVNGGGLGRRDPASASRNILSDETERKIRGVQYKFRHYRFLDFSGLLKGMENTQRARKRLLDNFWSNSTSISGARRNFGNFINMFSEFSKTVLNTIPVIKQAVIGLGALAAIKFTGPLLGGIAYKLGRNSLMSESTNTAIQNIAAYDMVRLTRGNDFNNIYRSATDIALKTGASRAGTVSLLNTLSGLTVGGTKLNDRDANFFANVASKISAVSGRDMQLVGLNLQQLLTTWQGIDMKELFKSVPLIEKYLFDIRARSKNQGEDIYSFIRNNPQALIDAFAQFAESFNLPESAIARGRVTLSEEELGITKTKSLEKFYVAIADLSVSINKSLEKLYEELGKVNWRPILNSFEDFITDIISIGASFAKFLQSDEFVRIKNIISNAAKGAAAGYVAGGPIGAGVGGIAGTIYGGIKEPDIYSPEQRALFSQLSNNNLLKNSLTNFGIVSRTLYRDKEGILRYSSVNNVPSTIKLSRDEYSKLVKELSFGSNRYKQMGYDLLKGVGTEEAIKAVLANMDNYKPHVKGTPGEDEAGKMQSLTRGSRALIINFNKSIVEMINNMQPNDTEALLKEMEEVAENAVTRGLHIAFNNATLAASSQ